LNILDRHCIPHEAGLINHDEHEIDSLRGVIKKRASIFHMDNMTFSSKLKKRKQQYGLAYFDNDNLRFCHELAKTITACRPKIDLLFYFGATNDKRVQKANGESQTLINKMTDIGKDVWLIKEPVSRMQRTFLLGTNGKFGSWKKEGWHLVSTDSGFDILERMNLTKKEYTEKYGRQMTLFGVNNNEN